MKKIINLLVLTLTIIIIGSQIAPSYIYADETAPTNVSGTYDDNDQPEQDKK